MPPRQLTCDITNKINFAADAQTSARGWRLISYRKAPFPLANNRRALAANSGELLHCYARLVRIGRHEVFLETAYVLARGFPGPLDRDLRRSTTQLSEQHYATVAQTGDIVIRMRAMQPDEGDLLGFEPYHAGIELEQMIRDASGPRLVLAA